MNPSRDMLDNGQNDDEAGPDQIPGSFTPESLLQRT